MKENKSVFKKFNILPKILCVLTAFIIWLYVAAVESPDHEETVYQVPISLVGVSAIENGYNLSVFSGYDMTVDINVKGQKSTINKYGVDDYNITADISDVTEGGRYTVNLSFDMPSGVTFVSASSKTADLYIDERTTTTINVYPKLRSVQVSGSYEMGELSSDTDTVVVSGPKILVEEISHAAVYLEAGTINSSVTMVGQLTLVNLSGEDVTNPYLKLSKNEVKVTVPLYTYKEVPVNVPTRHGIYNSGNSKITVTPAQIAVKGDPAILEKLNSVSTTAIDEKKIMSDCEMILSLQLPDKVTLADGETSNITVAVTHKGTTTKTLTIDNFKVEAPKDIEYSLQTASVKITLRGTAKNLEKIEVSDVTAVVDLNDFTETSGTITAPITILVKDYNNTVYAIGEYSVQVKIS